MSKKGNFLEIDVIIEPIIKFIAGRISYIYVYAFLELFQELDLQQIRIIFVRKTESDCLCVHMVNEGGNNINLGL